jgi:hypothetical protein
MAEQRAKPIIYELPSTESLFAPVEGNKRASLNWSVRDGYPRITVFTRTESDNGGKGVLTAPFDLGTILMLFDDLLRMAAKEGVQKAKVDTKHWPRDGEGKINGDLQATSEVWYGKDEDGMLWISVHALGPGSEQRPKIKFVWELDKYHEFTKEGRACTRAEMSVARYKTHYRVLTQAFIDMCAKFRDINVEREKRASGQPRAGGRQDNYKAAPATAEVEEDIPF